MSESNWKNNLYKVLTLYKNGLYYLKLEGSKLKLPMD